LSLLPKDHFFNPWQPSSAYQGLGRNCLRMWIATQGPQLHTENKGLTACLLVFMPFRFLSRELALHSAMATERHCPAVYIV
jgi:hypothetical protein